MYRLEDYYRRDAERQPARIKSMEIFLSARTTLIDAQFEGKMADRDRGSIRSGQRPDRATVPSRSNCHQAIFVSDIAYARTSVDSKRALKAREIMHSLNSCIIIDIIVGIYTSIASVE